MQYHNIQYRNIVKKIRKENEQKMKFDQTLTQLVLDLIEDEKSIPMLLGEVGIGKSSFFEALGKELNTQVFSLSCNQLADKADLTGARLVPTDDNKYKQVFFPHETIMNAIKYAEENPRETPLLFLDEINRTTPDVTSALLSIPTARKIGSVELPSNLRVAVAGNDKGNITSLDEASISRFMLIHIEPDSNTFISLDEDLNIYVKNVLQKYPDTIFCKTVVDIEKDEENDEDQDFIEDIFDADNEMKQLTTPRTIASLSRYLNKKSNDDLKAMLVSITNNDTTLLQEIIEGFVGYTRFTQKLLEEIINGINTNQTNTAQRAKAVKPNCYDELKSKASIQELQDFIINSMTEKERSESLVYALYEKEDNKIYIEELAKQIENIDNNALKTLTDLAMYHELDQQNVDDFTSTKLPLSDKLSIILSL